MRNQCVVIVLDSVGIGEAPDAADYDDEGADTLGNIARVEGGLHLPNLQKLGLGNIRAHDPLLGCPPADKPLAAFGALQEKAQGKDSATGHWALMGLHLDQPLFTYPQGFPPSLIDELTRRWNVPRVLGNCAASGTEIIHRLGQEHLKSGLPIVYTSADPVLQIAVHTDVVSLPQLYAWCEEAYDPAIAHGLNRVIARPFVGEYPTFVRTPDRRDFTMPPPKPTVLNALEQAGVRTLGIGKIASLFAHDGVPHAISTKNNHEGMEATLRAMRERRADFVFTNLVDFDQEYGHRRNPEGYHQCLQEFDARLPEFLAAMQPGDLLILTADHGNDPTFKGTDHTREYVPVLMVGHRAPAGADVGVRELFADVGQSVADFFGVDASHVLGTSMLSPAPVG